MKKELKIAIGIGAGGAAALGIGYLLTRKPPPLEPADFVVSDLVITPAEVYPGEPVSIGVTVTNISEVAGSYTVTCEVV